MKNVIKRTPSGDAFNFQCPGEFRFDAAFSDPETTKPLMRVTGLVGEDGAEIAPFLITCNTLISMGNSAKVALEIWQAQQTPNNSTVN